MRPFSRLSLVLLLAALAVPVTPGHVAGRERIVHIDFDDVEALCCCYIDVVALPNHYQPLGVLFRGPAPGDDHLLQSDEQRGHARGFLFRYGSALSLRIRLPRPVGGGKQRRSRVGVEADQPGEGITGVVVMSQSPTGVLDDLLAS